MSEAAAAVLSLCRMVYGPWSMVYRLRVKVFSLESSVLSRSIRTIVWNFKVYSLEFSEVCMKLQEDPRLRRLMGFSGVGFHRRRFVGGALPVSGPRHPLCVRIWSLVFGVWGVGFGAWGLEIGRAHV